MPITVLETLNWPGGGLKGTETKVTGDDRFGYDESAGTAWVLDGATDVGPYRLFDKEESDAAWLAEQLNRALIRRNPAQFNSIPAFFTDVLDGVRNIAGKQARIALDKAEASVRPISSGMWVWHDNEATHFVRSGDCVALFRDASGAITVLEHRESADLESETSKRLNAGSPEEKIQGLRDIRAIQNTEPRYAVLGLSPHAVDNLVIQNHSLPPETHVLLMTDGLWRLVEVYRLMTAEELLSEAIETGLEPLFRTLRKHERSLAEKSETRIKASDDACAILLQI